AGREDPHLQLPREPSYGPPDQAHDAPARPDPPGRARRVHRGALGRGAEARARDRRGTVAETLKKSSGDLGGKGVPSPRVDAEHLLAKALGLSRLELYTQHDRPVSETELDAARALLERRGHREPLAYVLGEWGFRRLTLHTDARALIPRPETE